jgi:hypothetical protein
LKVHESFLKVYESFFWIFMKAFFKIHESFFESVWKLFENLWKLVLEIHESFFESWWKLFLEVFFSHLSQSLNTRLIQNSCLIRTKRQSWGTWENSHILLKFHLHLNFQNKVCFWSSKSSALKMNLKITSVDNSQQIFLLSYQFWKDGLKNVDLKWLR